MTTSEQRIADRERRYDQLRTYATMVTPTAIMERQDKESDMAWVGRSLQTLGLAVGHLLDNNHKDVDEAAALEVFADQLGREIDSVSQLARDQANTVAGNLANAVLLLLQIEAHRFGLRLPYTSFVATPEQLAKVRKVWDQLGRVGPGREVLRHLVKYLGTGGTSGGGLDQHTWIVGIKNIRMACAHTSVDLAEVFTTNGSGLYRPTAALAKLVAQEDQAELAS